MQLRGFRMPRTLVITLLLLPLFALFAGEPEHASVFRNSRHQKVGVFPRTLPSQLEDSKEAERQKGYEQILDLDQDDLEAFRGALREKDGAIWKKISTKI